MQNVLEKCLTPTCEMIMDLLEIENSLINTNHPDFIGSADSLLNLFQADEEGERNFTLGHKRKSSANSVEILDDF